ncbi:MAG: tyrosine-type recombinase/integrase [Gaiellales bacterium]
MTVLSALDSAGRRRSPATLPAYHTGRPPRNKGLQYPTDPPTVEEIVALMRHAREDRHGWRLRALIVVLWRAGLRIQEALSLSERDLDARRGSLIVRQAKGGRRREIGMDDWGWEQLRPWLAARVELPVGALFCVIDGPTRGRPWSSPAVRGEFRRLAAEAGVRRRFAPHQLRHAHAVDPRVGSRSLRARPDAKRAAAAYLRPRSGDSPDARGAGSGARRTPTRESMAKEGDVATQEIDTAKVEQFAERMVGAVNDGMLCVLASIGHQTGLFDALAALPPSTSQQIAEAAGLDEPYVREWLGAMAVGQIVEYEPRDETTRFHRSGPHA